ncbi:MAG: TAT-variant-translocated molybdopterin oxidoreductase [Acidobacteria bacterium]|nr:TAT-variant-translocated molybdopterin oxidoreductase [Acidobacteriota bacterium]NIM61431.1 TAT-variant-translocated molybdopterin oxidoreductase [Acidobacteriota bacterium]NIO58094.1 TAT-variant-translocated molybdopterin oxidoreductase [Acidobacteriota bacterium]NIQ29103.1 TAT-variant-translocated molybdopterin oxidoreductase [Acidobacteriota bacterium]NIQ83647.1 TAT-variant-translocated molybdopterin oxidoreductase [Acidobacteriota bacterium]
MNLRPADRAYWRSLEQRNGDPSVRQFAEREFPEGASEAPEGVTRRTMLSLLGASVSLAGAAACRRPVEKIVPYVNAPVEVVPGIPRHFATTMPWGLDAYGVVVESHEGRPNKIEGNELHPSTAGRSNPFIQAAPLTLYDPDRSKHPIRYGEASTWAGFESAWAAIAEQLGDGSGLAFLTESWSSPTMARLTDAIHLRYPNAMWAAYESISDENIYRGLEIATGGQLHPIYHFDKAKVILTLDADPLQTESDQVRNTAGFAAGRQVSETHGSMGRLWAVEGVHSLTGANADHRLRLASSKIAQFVSGLGAQLGVLGMSGPMPAGVDAEWVAALVDDLAHHEGESLIVAGRRQPPEVHAAVYALNAALGNVGNTLDCRAFADAALPSRSKLAELIAAMQSGAVTNLIILGGNPVYDAPADLDFAGALEKVVSSIHLSDHVNETSQKVHWHLPRAQFLESWSDARSADGTMSVVQPLIRPLFDGRSDVEVLGLIAFGPDAESGAAPDGYTLVRATWDALLGGDEAAWNRVLHDGVLADSALPAQTPPAAGVAGPGSTSGSGLEIVFTASAAVYDGRLANNAWLQELPDSMTKITWDNAALLSPVTAAAQSLESGDLVTVAHRGAEIELPVWVQPGVADDTLVLSLGYGRTAAGRVGDGVGADTGRLRASSAMDIDSGATLTKTGSGYEFGQTQDHGTQDEPDLLPSLYQSRRRPAVREASLEDYRTHPTFANDMVNVPHYDQLWDDPESYDSGYQWGMTIDLNACTGCNACVVACQAENNIPVVGKDQVHRGREMHWLRVDRYFAGDEADPQTVFQPVPCMQCENAPCEQVCPVAATVHDSEGLNTMVYNRCIGTRYCANNCPYKVRRFNYYNFTKDTPEIVKLAQNPDVTVRSRGVMEKCTYCVQRINAGRIDAKLEERTIADGEVQTACQQACPANAIEFGNLLDENSRIVASKQSDRNYAMLAELLTRPRTTYLAKLRNPHPDLAPESTLPAKAEHHAEEEAH